jgi:spermidine/putrescine transport system substrate-binding protein
MKKFVFAALSLLLVLASLVSCSKEKQVLHVYNWADYMNPSVIDKFEKKYNCKVVMNYFDSNEALYAKLKAGATGYDILFPSGYMAKIMYEQKMIREIDHSRIPNMKNLDLPFLKKGLDPDMKYSVPYMVTYCGIAYNKKKVKNFKPSWSMFDRVDLKGRMTLLDDMREVIGAALKFNGYSYNTTNPAELQKAAEQVIRWKKNIAKFDVDEAKRGLSSGEFFLIQVYNGDALQLVEENRDLAFVLPQEGTSISQDNFVIPVSAKNPDLACKFIDFLLEPENSKDNMEMVNYLSPNLAGQKLMSEDFMEDPAINPPAEVLKKCDHLMDLGADNQKFSELWDRIKSAK